MPAAIARPPINTAKNSTRSEAGTSRHNSISPRTTSSTSKAALMKSFMGILLSYHMWKAAPLQFQQVRYIQRWASPMGAGPNRQLMLAIKTTNDAVVVKTLLIEHFNWHKGSRRRTFYMAIYCLTQVSSLRRLYARLSRDLYRLSSTGSTGNGIW